MKIIFYISTILFLLTGCFSNQTNNPLDLDEIRAKFSKDAEISNARTQNWENYVTTIYKIADTNQYLALNRIDKKIEEDDSLNKDEKSELHFMKGDIYYRLDSLQKSLDEFTTYGQDDNMSSPKELAARAGVYIKQKHFKKALEDLTNAAEINYDYYWNIGNYYEIIGKKDSAIIFYNKYYQKDSVNGKRCKERIAELETGKTKPLTELIYCDRKRVVLLWHAAK
jgi:hypothetical protein